MRRLMDRLSEWLLMQVFEPIWFTPYERAAEPLLSRKQFARRAFRSAISAMLVLHVSIIFGTLGYRWLAGLSWIDALLHASMLFGDMGQTRSIDSTIGKFFCAGYTLYGALIFLGCFTAIVLPWFHRIAHRLHLDPDEPPISGLIMVAKDGDVGRFCRLTSSERSRLEDNSSILHVP